MQRREFFKFIPAMALLPFSQEVSPPNTPSESLELATELSEAELRDLVIQLAVIARAREFHIFQLLNLTRSRDMNLGTIDWDGNIFQAGTQDVDA